MLKDLLEKLLLQRDLTKEESGCFVRAALKNAHPCQIAAILILMRAKGETVDELQGIIEEMRAHMVCIPLQSATLDIVGTGGDGLHTLNISTASAILAASCGVKVAKHGNRSISSLCGSADVIEALGISIHKCPQKISKEIENLGISFLFAPFFHPALQEVKEIRKGLNTRTFFNSVGPFLNPAEAQHLMLGVVSEPLAKISAELLLRLNKKHSFVFHGNGLDEISCAFPAHVIEVNEGKLRSFTLDPEEFGFKKCSLEELRGKDAAYNARKVMEVFEGEENGFSNTLVLNAGVACYLYGIATSLKEGFEIAKTALKEKKALDLINKWKSL